MIIKTYLNNLFKCGPIKKKKCSSKINFNNLIFYYLFRILFKKKKKYGIVIFFWPALCARLEKSAYAAI